MATVPAAANRPSKVPVTMQMGGSSLSGHQGLQMKSSGSVGFSQSMSASSSSFNAATHFNQLKHGAAPQQNRYMRSNVKMSASGQGWGNHGYEYGVATNMMFNASDVARPNAVGPYCEYPRVKSTKVDYSAVAAASTSRMPTVSRSKVVMSASAGGDNDTTPGSDTSSFRITGELSYLDRNDTEDYFDVKFRDANLEKKRRVQEAKLITAIKTPYTSTGRIDIEAFDRHVLH